MDNYSEYNRLLGYKLKATNRRLYISEIFANGEDSMLLLLGYATVFAAQLLFVWKLLTSPFETSWQDPLIIPVAFSGAVVALILLPFLYVRGRRRVVMEYGDRLNNIVSVATAFGIKNVTRMEAFRLDTGHSVERRKWRHVQLYSMTEYYYFTVNKLRVRDYVDGML